MTLDELKALLLEELMARAKAAVEAMTPTERAHMHHEQEISFVVAYLDLHQALAAALNFVNQDGPPPTEDQLTVLAEHVGGWFAHGYLIRGLIAQVRAHARTCTNALTRAGEVQSKGWTYGSAPRGVRLLVTARAPGGGLTRIHVATLSPDYEAERWFSEGNRLQGVIAWMFLPPEAEEPA